MNPTDKISKIAERLSRIEQTIDHVQPIQREGFVTRVVGLKLEVTGLVSPVGSKCLVQIAGKKQIEGEVVGFSGETLYLMTADHTMGITPGARVRALNHSAEVAVGPHLLGRILDGAGMPLDGLAPVIPTKTYPLISRPLNPLSRHPIEEPLDVGIRAINGLLTIGRGQRIGLFAGSGVGKSVLLGMMALYTTAEVIVVGLIGERGREVKEFIEHNLGPEGLKRAVVIAAPADTSPLMRLHGALWATTIAEYFRDQGKQVLLLLDSLTRYAQAQRELALAIGEPPATKGYTPSVFAKLAQLVERAGNAEQGGGSITAFYTVLTEGDDQQDPIADSARAILDGHIVLSRRLAEAGQYPAIDIEASISRVMPNVVSKEQLQYAHSFKRIYSHYQQNKDYIKMGVYQAGSDAEVDLAVNKSPMMIEYLRQNMDENFDLATSWAQIRDLFDQ